MKAERSNIRGQHKGRKTTPANFSYWLLARVGTQCRGAWRKMMSLSRLSLCHSHARSPFVLFITSATEEDANDGDDDDGRCCESGASFCLDSVSGYMKKGDGSYLSSLPEPNNGSFLSRLCGDHYTATTPSSCNGRLWPRKGRHVLSHTACDDTASIYWPSWARSVDGFYQSRVCFCSLFSSFIFCTTIRDWGREV